MLPAQTCVRIHCQLTVTEQLTALVLSRPGSGAPAIEAAAWYERQAAMLDQAAAEYGPDVSASARQETRDNARAARAHAAWLRERGDALTEPTTAGGAR